MAWYPVVGYGVFWIALIAAIILYIVTRKWHPIAYLIAISLYIFTVSFTIDVFDLGKNYVIGILGFSAILMIGMGWFISRRVSS